MSSHWLKIGAWNPFDDRYVWIEWEQWPTSVNALARFNSFVERFGGDNYDGPPLLLVDEGSKVVAEAGLRFVPTLLQTRVTDALLKTAEPYALDQSPMAGRL